MRYAIGKLAAAGFFATDRDSAQGVIPINFVTLCVRGCQCRLQPARNSLSGGPQCTHGSASRCCDVSVPCAPCACSASPHLGSWNYPDSLYHRMYNAVLPYTLSRTGSQLVLADRCAHAFPTLHQTQAPPGDLDTAPALRARFSAVSRAPLHRYTTFRSSAMLLCLLAGTSTVSHCSS